MEANPQPAEREKGREPAKIIQLPLWPEPVRGMPNPALRSALFSAIHSKDRRFIDREQIASVNGVEIRFTGKQLNQEDLEVCAEIFHLARLHPLGDTCHTTAHGLLKRLGRSTGKTNHQQLHECLLRLQAHSVEINGPRFEYFGSLVLEGIKDKLTRHYLIKVSPTLAPVFQNGWTALHAEQRRKLRRKPLALWLHGFYASHTEPYPYKVETLRELSGSRTVNLKHYRAALRVAFDELRAIGAITRWNIEDDLAHVHKPPTITQHRPKKIQK
jgi:hypothetical protein